MSGNVKGRDVAVEGTGTEMRTSGPNSRATGDQEWREQEAQMCLRCGHPQRWSNVHQGRSVAD